MLWLVFSHAIFNNSKSITALLRHLWPYSSQNRKNKLPPYPLRIIQTHWLCARAGVNGYAFPPEAPATAYAAFVKEQMRGASAYGELARSSFAEYQTRLNWDVAGRAVRSLLAELLATRQQPQLNAPTPAG